MFNPFLFRGAMSTAAEDSIRVDWDERYAALADHAVRVARRIYGDGDAPTGSESASYLFTESRLLIEAYVDGGRPRRQEAAADALDAVAAAWESIRQGTESGEEVFQRHNGLWPRLMSEWPMGHYAQMSANALADVDLALETVVELGAGVGATTRLIRDVVHGRGGRLVATDLHYGRSLAVDFDQPLLPQVPIADAVVATNALHCARDPVVTLGWIRQVLRPGGVLILGEGAPFPEQRVPWALNLLFGACRGWYNRGGFRTPAFWLDAMRTAGFNVLDHSPWPSNRYELGGVYTAT